MVSIQIAAADTGENDGSNQTNASPSYYITLDPIGNYTLGNVLYSNGTTNLPVSDTLLGSIYTSRMGLVDKNTNVEYPGCLLPDISITSISSGINQWSAKVPGTCIRGPLAEWSPYIVVVQNNNDSVSAGQYLTVLPTPNVTQTSVQISIPPTPLPNSTTLPLPATTQSSPFSSSLPIAVIVAMVIEGSRRRKK